MNISNHFTFLFSTREREQSTRCTYI